MCRIDIEANGQMPKRFVSKQIRWRSDLRQPPVHEQLNPRYVAALVRC